MKKITALLTTLALLMGLCACKSTAARWQEQYDLGMRYLSDGNYEEAILAFNAAIEIDPMQADAYLNLANAYIGMNDFDAAREILEEGYELTGSQLLKDKLDEIESGNIFDFWNNARKLSGYDASGNLQWYHIYEYSGKQRVSVTTYNAAGIQIGYWDGFQYDEQGREIRSMMCTDEGIVHGYSEPSYDENDHIVRSVAYLLDGTMLTHDEYVYDENGSLASIYYYRADESLSSYSEFICEGDLPISVYDYGPDGTLRSHMEYRYDENGKMIGTILYDADGTKIMENTMER